MSQNEYTVNLFFYEDARWQHTVAIFVVWSSRPMILRACVRNCFA